MEKLNLLKKVLLVSLFVFIVVGVNCPVNAASTYNFKTDNLLDNLTQFEDEMIIPIIYNVESDSEKISSDKIKADFKEKGLVVNSISTETIGTGTKITIENNFSYTILIYGDVNGDGQVDINDILRMAAHITGYKEELKGIYFEAANLKNDDDEIDIFDMLKAASFIVNDSKLVTEDPEIMPIEEKLARIELDLLEGFKTTYNYGEELDLTDGKVVRIMTSGNKANSIDLSIEMVSGYNSTKSGEQELEVNYEGKKATLMVNVLEKVTKVAIDDSKSIHIVKSENLNLVDSNYEFTIGEINEVQNEENTVSKVKKADLNVTVTPNEGLNVELEEDENGEVYLVGKSVPNTNNNFKIIVSVNGEEDSEVIFNLSVRKTNIIGGIELTGMKDNVLEIRSGKVKGIDLIVKNIHDEVLDGFLVKDITVLDGSGNERVNSDDSIEIGLNKLNEDSQQTDNDNDPVKGLQLNALDVEVGISEVITENIKLKVKDFITPNVITIKVTEPERLATVEVLGEKNIQFTDSIRKIEIPVLSEEDYENKNYTGTALVFRNNYDEIIELKNGDRVISETDLSDGKVFIRALGMAYQIRDNVTSNMYRSTAIMASFKDENGNIIENNDYNAVISKIVINLLTQSGEYELDLSTLTNARMIVETNDKEKYELPITIINEE